MSIKDIDVKEFSSFINKLPYKSYQTLDTLYETVDHDNKHSFLNVLNNCIKNNIVIRELHLNKFHPKSINLQ